MTHSKRKPDSSDPAGDPYSHEVFCSERLLNCFLPAIGVGGGKRKAAAVWGYSGAAERVKPPQRGTP